MKMKYKRYQMFLSLCHNNDELSQEQYFLLKTINDNEIHFLFCISRKKLRDKLYNLGKLITIQQKMSIGEASVDDINFCRNAYNMHNFLFLRAAKIKTFDTTKTYIQISLCFIKLWNKRLSKFLSIIMNIEEPIIEFEVINKNIINSLIKNTLFIEDKK